ncbi:MAG: multidrug efflux MFS transporter [Alphaproteobacteria bacterium]|nr:multidrug efflux MFS transporter [Alphaproteobacteria bacterium]
MPSPAIAPTHARPHFRTIALVVGAAVFMEQMDATILATALPGMARDLGVSAPSLSIALTSYLISLAVFIPASGWLADRLGGRTLFRGAILFFTAASALCAFAPNVAFLAAARFLQGMGGAMMIPVGRLLLFRSIEKRDMVNAMSWVLVPALLGPIVGPPLGGLIVTFLDWRWIFFLNLPVGLVGALLVNRYFAPMPGEKGAPFDVRGMILSALSLGTLLFGLESASHVERGAGQVEAAVWLIGFGLVMGWLYLRHARATENPILDPRLMRVRSFRISMIAGSLTRITQGAQPFLLPLMMQLGFGLSAAQSGFITLATALGSIGMKAVAPKVLRRYGFRDSLVVGGFIACGGYALCALFRPSWPPALIFAVLMACGFFMSFQFTAYNTVAYDRIPPERLAVATSFYTTFQQLMLSVGICIGAMGLEGAMAWRHHAVPTLPDFSVAFVVVCAISLTAYFWNRRFRPTDGVEFSGHTPRTWSLRQALKDMRGLNP